jgi:hypothetical protein
MAADMLLLGKFSKLEVKGTGCATHGVSTLMVEDMSVSVH